MKIKKLPKDKWENCPYCENKGTYVTYRTIVIPMETVKEKNQPVDTFESRPNYHHCRWCHSNLASVYNQKKLREEEKVR